MTNGTSRADFTIVAQNHVMARAFADGRIDPTEASQLMGIILEEADPDKQIDLSSYFTLKNNFAQFEIATKVPIPFEDKTQEQQFRYLLGSFPGSTAHFKETLKRKGVDSIKPDENLPEMGLHALRRDSKDPQNIIIELDFEGKIQSVVYDVRLPMMQQTFLQDPAKQLLFFDAINLLAQIEGERLFLPEEQPVIYDLCRSLGPLLSLADFFALQAQLVGVEGVMTLPRGSEIILDGQNSFTPKESFPLNLYSDWSLNADEINQIIQDVKAIVGEPVLSFLREKSWRVFLHDAENLSEQEQRQHLMQEQPVFSMSQPGISYTLSDGSFLILIDTHGSIEALVYVVVHELMHALCYELEGASHLKEVSLSQDIPNGILEPIEGKMNIGPYWADFVARMFQRGESLDLQPSVYGASNEAEHFAELATHYFLERAGRQDLYDTRSAINPKSRASLFFMNPMDYLMIDKLVQTVEGREKDPDSYNTLLARGIDDDLFDACYRFYNQEGIAGSEISEQGQRDLIQKWGRERLHDLYQVDDGVEESTGVAEKIRDLLTNCGTAEVQTLFLPDAQGHFQMKSLVYRFADFNLIQLACKMLQAKTREEKMAVFRKHRFQGSVIQDRTTLEAFYKTLRVLDRDEVDAVINPDGLIDEVALAYQEDLKEYGRWLDMQRPDNPFTR